MGISSETEIYNLALNAVGERSNISLPTETSRPAEVCRLWYSPVVELALSAAPWPEVTKIEYLGQTAEKADGAWLATEPRPGYTYAYTIPADLLRPQYLTDFTKFLVSYLGDSRVLNTNTYQAALAYTANITDVSIWSPELRMAIVYALAAHICMPLTGKPSRTKMLIDKANELLINARLGAANTSNEVLDSVPSWLAARGYSGATSQQYIYPLGSLFTMGVVGVN